MKPLLRINHALRATTLSSTVQQTLLFRPTRSVSTMQRARPTLSPSATISRSRVLPSPHTLSTSSTRRSYSTAPNQQQVLQSFGTPFAQFVYTISRIARIITYSALGVATIGVVSFEAAHQYVEHVAMPASSASSRNTSDEYGWSELALDESWSGSPTKSGTDPRLGIKGRHAVRSAWMCVNWGGGISPSVMFGGSTAGNSGLGRTAITSMGSAKALHVDDGMILAMQYLNLAVKIAAAKGIKLPDTDAIRAGLIGEAAAKEQLENVDPLALALEARLAAVKERQGSRGALESAIASYERLYDIAAATGGEQPARLVRLATKLGDLHSALDRRDEAEEWINRAVGIAAAAGARMPELHQKQVSVDKVEVAKEQKKGRWGGWFSKNSSVDASADSGTGAAVAAVTAAAAAPVTTNAEVAATPALTRSLITALVSKSALHAHTPTPTSLQHALQTQMSALQLSTAELQRLLPLPSPAHLEAQLHHAWITHHQSILDLHIAETIYALTRGASPGSSKMVPKWFGHSGGKVGEKSIAWVDQAEERAQTVIRALQGGNVGKGKKGAKEEEVAVVLDERWSSDRAVALAAGRVLRDAKRVQATARKTRATLEQL